MPRALRKCRRAIRVHGPPANELVAKPALSRRHGSAPPCRRAAPCVAVAQLSRHGGGRVGRQRVGDVSRPSPRPLRRRVCPGRRAERLRGQLTQRLGARLRGRVGGARLRAPAAAGSVGRRGGRQPAGPILEVRLRRLRPRQRAARPARRLRKLQVDGNRLAPLLRAGPASEARRRFGRPRRRPSVDVCLYAQRRAARHNPRAAGAARARRRPHVRPRFRRRDAHALAQTHEEPAHNSRDPRTLHITPSREQSARPICAEAGPRHDS
mmetsp:Transcript_20240/g.72022  ORF Transcript_20240/g.72022 Transcript_20240/m.72022 type:complete len:267 (-) Transcript_20240:95-895(-)